jgi:hypothetical protein
VMILYSVNEKNKEAIIGPRTNNTNPMIQGLMKSQPQRASRRRMDIG